MEYRINGFPKDGKKIAASTLSANETETVVTNSRTEIDFREDAPKNDDEEDSTGTSGDDIDDDEDDLGVLVREPEDWAAERASGGGAITFSPFEVAQAFSHFSYVVSGKKRLVCDIQGVYDKRANLMRISDPVVHYYNRRKEHRRCVHGRTDLGWEGIDKFFSTHECSELCKLVVLGLRTPRSVDRYRKKRAYVATSTTYGCETPGKEPRLAQLSYQDSSK